MNASLLSRPTGRRDFLKLTGLAGGGFALAFYIRSGNDAVAAAAAVAARRRRSRPAPWAPSAAR